MIWVLVGIVVVSSGFYILKSNNPTINVVDNTPIVSNPTPVIPTTNTSTVLVPSAPIVKTSQNNFVSSSTAELSGLVTPNGASTTYWFDYGISTAFGNESVAQAIGSGDSSISATGFISGLSANTLYYYRLSAKNKFATVNGTMYSFQTNNNPPISAVKTTAQTNGATNISNNTATLNGEVNPNGTATNYWYEYGTNTNFGYTTQFLGTNSGITFMSVPAQISNLIPLTKYYFRLNAQNQFGTVNGSVASFTTTGPAASSKPTVQTSNATNINSSSATLNGHINPNGADTIYWFEYSKDSLLSTIIGSGTQQTIIAGATSKSVNASIADLQANTKYYYHLAGSNKNGVVYGSVLSFTTRK